MKKLILLLCALLSTVGGVVWAQTNYASGIAPTIFFNPSGNEYTSENLNKLTDGTKTGGEGAALILSNVDMTVSDAFYLNLGSGKTIGGFEITWSGKHCKLYKLYGTNTAPTTCADLAALNEARTSWTLLYNNLSDPVTESLAADQQKTVVHMSVDASNSYQYVVFVPLNDGGVYDMYYGAGIVEMEVLSEVPAPVLTTITATVSSASLSLASVETTTITTTGYDQYGNTIATGALEYTLYDTDIIEVSSEGVITPKAVGNTTVTVSANSGAITTTVHVSVYPGTFNVPTTIPTAPTLLKDNVIPVYSEEYGKGLATPSSGYGTGLYSFTNCEEVIIANGHKVVHVEGNKFNSYTKGNSTVTSEYTKAYVAIYPKTATSGWIYEDGVKINVEITGLVSNEWNYIELDVTPSASKNYMEVCLDGETEFYLDNFYFAKATTNDTSKPVYSSSSSVTAAGKTASLNINFTDNNDGILTYSIKRGGTEISNKRGRAGESITITIPGLTSETNYPAGTFTISATDAAGNESDAYGVPEFTTTVMPMGETVSATITSSTPSENGKTLNYTWVFTQSGEDVTVTFGYANGGTQDNQGITGFVDGYTYHDGTEGSGMTYTWTGCTVGQKLTAQHKWLFSGGDFFTPIFTYVVASTTGDGAGLVKQPADANGVIEILGTGAITAEAFNSLTTTEEKAYDLTELKVTSAVTLEAKNSNAVFIVKDAAQKTSLAGTKNMVIWKESESRYEGGIEIVDQNNANTFATNLPIYATTVSYTRNVEADKYVTIALPFTPTSTTSGFSAYEVDGGVSDGKINFQKTTTGMTAGTAYMLHNTDATADFEASASGVELDFTEGTTGLFRSVFNAKSLTAGDNAYILSGGKFKKALTGASIGGFRGYIYYTGALSRDLEITIDGDITGINDVKSKKEEGHGVLYNLQGQEVKNPSKGIYIMNGKKFIKK